MSLERSAGVLIDAPIGKHRIVHCERTGQYFRLGVREADFLEQLDGSRSEEELRENNAQMFTGEQVDHLLAWFRAQHLLGDTAPELLKPDSRWFSRVWRFILRPDQFRIRLLNPDTWLNRNRNLVDSLFSRGALGVYLLLLLSPVLAFLIDPRMAQRATHQVHAPVGLEMLVLYIGMLVVNVLHEFAHALACKHFGGKVEKIGLMFLYINPVIYCDVSDSWRFKAVEHKVVVTLAGIFLQALFSAVGTTAWLVTGSSLWLNFVVFNTFVALFNFFPFIKLDGYWMLVHLTNEPNLKAKGLAVVQQTFRRYCLRQQSSATNPSSPLITAYGFAHMLAIPLFWYLGLYGLYSRLSAASTLLAIAVVGLFGGALLYRAGKSLLDLSRPAPQN